MITDISGRTTARRAASNRRDHPEAPSNRLPAGCAHALQLYRGLPVDFWKQVAVAVISKGDGAVSGPARDLRRIDPSKREERDSGVLQVVRPKWPEPGRFNRPPPPTCAPHRRYASRRSSNIQAIAYTMVTNRHMTPKPGQGWRVCAEW